mgnify:FL=1
MAVALGLAILLHLILILIPREREPVLIGSPPKELLFELEPMVSAPVSEPSPGSGRSLRGPGEKPAAVERRTAPRTERPADATMSPKSGEARPKIALTPGLLSRQISEISESLVQQQRAQNAGRRVVHAKEAKKYPAILQAYESAFKAKVEQIGNLNYPEGARREHLSGTVQLAVAIEPDGKPYSIRVLKSSGIPVLDEGALRIARLSAPFAPLPAELLEEMDVLVITRTWHFDDQARFSSR